VVVLKNSTIKESYDLAFPPDSLILTKNSTYFRQLLENGQIEHFKNLYNNTSSIKYVQKFNYNGRLIRVTVLYNFQPKTDNYSSLN